MGLLASAAAIGLSGRLGRGAMRDGGIWRAAVGAQPFDKVEGNLAAQDISIT